LFLAVPISAYNGILSELLGVLARQTFQVKLVVFDPNRMEVIQWLP
jgi:hypothetical protein